MLSRVAESMFWMSRYVERAENVACFLDVSFHLSLDLRKMSAENTADYWESLILVTADRRRFFKLYEQADARTVTDFLVCNRSNPNSIFSCVALARENARSIIESISNEMWEHINNLYHFVQAVTEQSIVDDPYSFYREIKSGSQLFQGTTDSTLLRNEGWDFVQAGKYLERADNTARLVDVKYHLLSPSSDQLYGPEKMIQWMAVLKSCSALQAFRKVHGSRIEPDAILRFLLLDRAFPRSIFFSLGAVEGALWHISGSTRGRCVNHADRLIGKLGAELAYTTVEDIYQKGLHDFLVELEQRLVRVGEQIHHNYFAYHAPNTEEEVHEVALPFTGMAGSRATWSQAEQQQQ